MASNPLEALGEVLKAAPVEDGIGALEVVISNVPAIREYLGKLIDGGSPTTLEGDEVEIHARARRAIADARAHNEAREAADEIRRSRR